MPGPGDLVRPTGASGRLSRDPTELLERHGAALVALAMVLLGNRARAEALARDAILDACSGPAHPVQGADRWELARYVFVRSERLLSGGAPGTPALTSTADATVVAAVPDPAPLHLVALALAMFGGHTHLEVARLLHLSDHGLAELLRASAAA